MTTIQDVFWIRLFLKSWDYTPEPWQFQGARQEKAR